jgi:hypothetical protein
VKNRAGGFGVPAEIELQARRVDVFEREGVVRRMGAEAAAHDHEFANVAGHRVIKPQRKREIRERPEREDGNLAGKLPHFSREEDRGGLRRRARAWRSLNKRGHYLRRVKGAAFHRRFLGPYLSPCALVGKFSVTSFPAFSRLGRIDQRPSRSGDHRNIGPSDDLQQPQRVCDILRTPTVTALNRDPEHLDVG